MCVHVFEQNTHFWKITSKSHMPDWKKKYYKINSLKINTFFSIIHKKIKGQNNCFEAVYRIFLEHFLNLFKFNLICAVLKVCNRIGLPITDKCMTGKTTSSGWASSLNSPKYKAFVTLLFFLIGANCFPHVRSKLKFQRPFFKRLILTEPDQLFRIKMFK